MKIIIAGETFELSVFEILLQRFVHFYYRKNQTTWLSLRKYFFLWSPCHIFRSECFSHPCWGKRRTKPKTCYLFSFQCCRKNRRKSQQKSRVFLSLLLWSLLYDASPSGTLVLINVPSPSHPVGKGGSSCSGLLRLIYKRSGSLRVMTDSSEPGLYFLLKNFLPSSALIPIGAQDLERVLCN